MPITRPNNVKPRAQWIRVLTKSNRVHEHLSVVRGKFQMLDCDLFPSLSTSPGALEMNSRIILSHCLYADFQKSYPTLLHMRQKLRTQTEKKQSSA